MIIKDKIELDFDDQLKYYRVSIILLIIATLCFFNGLFNIEHYSISQLNTTSNKIGVFLILLGMLSFLVKKKDLKLKRIDRYIDTDTFTESLERLIEKERWEVDLKTKNSFVLKTDRYGGGGRFFISKSYGEIIYITINGNSLYLKSIFDFDKNIEITVSSGENNLNEKLITNLIKSSHNN